MSAADFPRTQAVVHEQVTRNIRATPVRSLADAITEALHGDPLVGAEFTGEPPSASEVENVELRALVVSMFNKRGDRGKNRDWLAKFTEDQQRMLVGILGDNRF